MRAVATDISAPISVAAFDKGMIVLQRTGLGVVLFQDIGNGVHISGKNGRPVDRRSLKNLRNLIRIEMRVGRANN